MGSKVLVWPIIKFGVISDFFFLDDALDFENHQTLGGCFWFGPTLPTTTRKDSFLVLLTQVFTQRQLANMVQHVVHPVLTL